MNPDNFLLDAKAISGFRQFLSGLPVQAGERGMPNFANGNYFLPMLKNPMVNNMKLSPSLSRYFDTIGSLESNNKFSAIEKQVGFNSYAGTNKTPGLGRYQFTGNTFKAYSGGLNPQQFLSNPAAQNQAMYNLTKDNAMRFNRANPNSQIDLNNLTPEGVQILARMHNTGSWKSDGYKNYGSRAYNKFIQN